MILLKKGQLNKMAVSASQNKLLSNPVYLFSFQHIMSGDKVIFYPQNITSGTSDRYDEFQFIESDTNTGYSGSTPYKYFRYEGQYYYGIYENITTGTTSPSASYNKVNEGRALVIDLNDAPIYEQYISPNETNNNFIYIPGGISNGILTENDFFLITQDDEYLIQQ